MWRERRRRGREDTDLAMMCGRSGEANVPGGSTTDVTGQEAVERSVGAEASLVRLGELNEGEQATVQGFDAGHNLVSRLSALGFTPQAEVVMIQNFGSGPLIVKVRDTRIALGRGEAMKVRVKR
jgi:ferrous iron transport protein A